MNPAIEDQLQIRIHGDDSKPTLVYLPGVHGDWTLVSSFREQMKPHVRFVEFTYPRTLDWSLDDYAESILNALAGNNIGEGVVLAESFGSQVIWQMLGKCMEGRDSGHPADGKGARGPALPFNPTTLILAGGFGRFPFIPLVSLTRFIWSIMPKRLIRFSFWAYARFARWRHRNAPETAAAISEFIGRRTPEDLRAIDHRFKLIRENDPGKIARQVELPVFQLTGFWDPVVNYPSVRRWLRANCPGYRKTVVMFNADHSVLGTAPEQSANLVRDWI